MQSIIANELHISNYCAKMHFVSYEFAAGKVCPDMYEWRNPGWVSRMIRVQFRTQKRKK